jgi:phosphoglycolate phosphatase-like HAD superfamily hydrolase
MTRKGIILFDIDRTIFDTDAFSKALELELWKVTKNASVEDIQEAKREFISSLIADREFDPEKFIEFLCGRFDLKNQSKLLSVFYNPKDKRWYSNFVFPETFEVFTKLRNNFRLGIYSEGTKKFQNYKFKSMKISNYLDKDLVLILDHKTNSKALAIIPPDSIIVDDKRSVCEYLSKNGIKVVWLNRKRDPINDQLQTIYSLLELPGILL